MEHDIVNTNEAGENLKRTFSGTLDDAEELVRMTADEKGEQVAAARNKITRSLSRARRDLQRMQVQAGETARRAACGVDGYVHTHPWPALGLAALLGVVIGMLAARHDQQVD
ncbi:MAG: DUF883 domain-containing protein [Burkholderiales bacterium]|nr:DUF883 domain-containing protein [Burkholderiales bacterium]